MIVHIWMYFNQDYYFGQVQIIREFWWHFVIADVGPIFGKVGPIKQGRVITKSPINLPQPRNHFYVPVCT